MPFILNVAMFSHPDYWIDKEGKLVEISSMNDSYISNTIKFIRNRYPGKTDTRIGKLCPQFTTMTKEHMVRQELIHMPYSINHLEERDW